MVERRCALAMVFSKRGIGGRRGSVGVFVSRGTVPYSVFKTTVVGTHADYRSIDGTFHHNCQLQALAEAAREGGLEL